MAMNGETLGLAIGNALYDAIPASVKNCMSSCAKAEMCQALQDSWKIAGRCIVDHITTYGSVTTPLGIPVGPSPTSVIGATLCPGIGSIS